MQAKTALVSYWSLLQLILPVFALIGAGIVLRGARWLRAEADPSLLNLVVKFLYPALILDNVLGNEALHSAGNLVLPPLLAFLGMAIGLQASAWGAGLIGLEAGQPRRTFAFTCGLYNYAYIPVPLVAGLYGRGTLGVLLVHNVGCEAAIWTIGIVMLAGTSGRQGWRRALNPPTFALAAAVVLNLTGAGRAVPTFVLAALHLCAVCAVPLGLILIGATLEEFVRRDPLALFDPKVTVASLLLRLAILPLTLLALAKWLPLTIDLKRVLVVQAAMPAAILPLVIAKHYGGHSRTAAQVIVGTNLASLALIPLWLKWGAELVGV